MIDFQRLFIHLRTRIPRGFLEIIISDGAPEIRWMLIEPPASSEVPWHYRYVFSIGDNEMLRDTKGEVDHYAILAEWVADLISRVFPDAKKS